MTTFVEILSIIVPALDENAKISIAKAEERLIAANFDFEEADYTKAEYPNYIELLFSELDNRRGIVTIERTDEGEVMIAYHAERDPFVKEYGTTPVPPTEPGTKEDEPVTEEEYNRRVIEFINAEGEDGRVLISLIGLKIGKVPTAEKGEKMGTYFRRYPELFVVDPLYVTLRGCETDKEPVGPGKEWTMDKCEEYIRAVIDYILANGENGTAHLSKVGHYVGKAPTESTGVKLSQYLKQHPELFDVNEHLVTLKEGAENYQPKVKPEPTPAPTPAEQGEQGEQGEKPEQEKPKQPAEEKPEQPILGERPAKVDEPTQREPGAHSPQEARGAQPVQEVLTIQSAKSVQEVAASLYDLDHFAAFDDREAALCELAKLAEPDGWALLPEGEANRYLMVEAKLKLNFAMAVKELLEEANKGIVIALNAASFDTRFRTPEGRVIIARFVFNRRRSEANWQQYRFHSFVVK
ncbi:MAG: hypothetical protein J6Q33_02665 [Alistipes sp.]|nr:hypothetical protein [Alistipes sp.]